jgi:hypothetical protein
MERPMRKEHWSTIDLSEDRAVFFANHLITFAGFENVINCGVIVRRYRSGAEPSNGPFPRRDIEAPRASGAPTNMTIAGKG